MLKKISLKTALVLMLFVTLHKLLSQDESLFYVHETSAQSGT